MEKLKSSLVAKAIAMALAVVSLLFLIASFAGMAAMDAAGSYRLRKEEMKEDAFHAVCHDYSVVAIAGHREDFGKEELSKTNFLYGVVKAKDRDKVDFYNPANYIAGNFVRIPDVSEMHFEEFDIGEETSFTLGNGSILDRYYAAHAMPYTEESCHVDGYVYDRHTKAFYVRSGNSLFSINSGVLVTASFDEGARYREEPLSNAEAYIQEAQKPQGVRAYRWDEEFTMLTAYRPSFGVEARDILIMDTSSQKEFTVEADATITEIDIDVVWVQREAKSEHYIVASAVNLPLAGEQTFTGGDMFVQMSLLIDFIYRMHYAVIAIVVVSLIVLVASFCFLMAAAGHHKGQTGIHAQFFDHIPLDLYLAGVFAAETGFAFLAVFSMEAADSMSSSYPDLSGYVTAGVVTLAAGIFGILLLLFYCMSFSVRVKLGKWWRHTLVSIICRKILHAGASVLRFVWQVVLQLCRSVTLLWKLWLFLALLAFVELAVVYVGYYSRSHYMFLWAMEKAVLYPLLILVCMQVSRLQKGAQRIANGELGYRIDTRHMLWELKKHGEYLNDIGKGMDCAVNERMKSERFKTELITNVSHDIKTPLTSIINYVDLLQKEQIENPAVQEYLEVLHRQSARLKKLIEDLMEASKASTGSLNVVMEKCNAGVMLVQTVGEFEEKLMEGNIELQIKKPETELYIHADHRHLWRVFDNLMNNMCKYAQPSTRAYVNLEQDGQRAVVIFRNISKYPLNISSEELMERFVRGDSSRNTEGSGLGISIAKSLTELMDGTFDLLVDGDLFKVVLTFPLYGTALPHPYAPPSQKIAGQELGADGAWEKASGQDANVLDGLAAGIQHAGTKAASFGQGVAHKVGQMARRAGRFAHHVKMAAQQAKEEESRMDMPEDGQKFGEGGVREEKPGRKT